MSGMRGVPEAMASASGPGVLHCFVSTITFDFHTIVWLGGLLCMATPPWRDREEVLGAVARAAAHGRLSRRPKWVSTDGKTAATFAYAGSAWAFSDGTASSASRKRRSTAANSGLRPTGSRRFAGHGFCPLQPAGGTDGSRTQSLARARSECARSNLLRKSRSAGV